MSTWDSAVEYSRFDFFCLDFCEREVASYLGMQQQTWLKSGASNGCLDWGD